QDQRRATHLQLSALAVRLLGARVQRAAVAGLRSLRPGRGAGRVRGQAAALRRQIGGPVNRRETGGGLLGGEELLEPGGRRERRRQGADTGRRRPGRGGGSRSGGETFKRILFAIPWIAFAIAIVVAGGAVFAAAMVVIGVLCLREFFAVTH